MNKIILNRDYLYEKNIIENISQKELSKILNVSVDTIQRNMKEYGIKREQGQWNLNKPLIITGEELEIINGCLLGDGCLTKNGRSENNAQFTYTNKNKDIVDYIYNKLNRFMKKVEYYEYKDKRTNKVYSRYSVRSELNSTFTILYNKWYINKIKTIPTDLILTSNTCYHWYIDDGSLIQGKSSQNIKLSTHCFNKKDLEDILLPQLSIYEPKLYKAEKEKEQFFIYISRKNIPRFLNYIGKCNIMSYLYKWEYQEYKNKAPTNHKYKQDAIINLIKQGLNNYQIGKILGMDASLVRYYKNKNLKVGEKHNEE